MAKKIVQYTVTVEIDDNGEFDRYAMRDGIMAGIQTSQNDGGLTTLDDESTIQRHKAGWIAEGFDGISIARQGYRWYAPFKVGAIEIVGVRLVAAEKEVSRLPARKP